MALVRQNWQNRNAQRSFPIEESAGRMSAAGSVLPPNILVTAKLKFPDTLGSRACVSGISVGPTMVSAIFVATDAAFSAASVVPLGAVTVAKPFVVGRPYAITAMVAGVGGWAAFGDGGNQTTPVSYRFTDPAQAPIIVSQAKPYPALPISGFSKEDSSLVMDGTIAIRGAGDLVIETDTRTIDGENVTCVVFRLDRGSNPEVLKEYCEPCGHVPESGTCDFTPIRRVNTVTPDDDGDISIIFADPFVAVPLANGISLNLPVSQQEVCEATDSTPDQFGNLPGTGEDQCDG